MNTCTESEDYVDCVVIAGNLDQGDVALFDLFANVVISKFDVPTVGDDRIVCQLDRAVAVGVDVDVSFATGVEVDVGFELLWGQDIAVQVLNPSCAASCGNRRNILRPVC